MSKFKKIPMNTAGRDFVVGDIHGAFGLMKKCLADVKFDTRKDRLFCLGDLVDRGVQSPRVKELLAYPFVYSVLGNHEDMIVDSSIDEIRQMAARDINGMAWLNNESDASIKELQGLFAQLPVAMEIQTTRGTVGLVHAEIPLGMNWGEFTAALEGGDRTVTQTALWGRSRIKSGNTQGVMGVGRVFVGHNIQFGGPHRLGNIYAIDSGAVLQELGVPEGSMTMVDIISETRTLVSKANPQPCELFLTPGEGLFGQYARPRQTA